jgi:hypothetical protein
MGRTRTIDKESKSSRLRCAWYYRKMAANSLVAASALALGTMLLVSCSPAVHSYALSREDQTTILVPPGITIPTKGALEIKLLNARRAPFPRAGCEINRDPIELQWRGSAAVIRVKTESGLLGYGQDASKGDQASLDPLKYINELRQDLIGLESRGCLHPGEAQKLAADIAERLPFQPFVAYELRFGAFDLNQFIDLTPDFRLRIVYPIYVEENHVQTREIKGVETVYYEIVSDQRDGRVRISEITAGKSSSRGSSPQGSAKQIAQPFPRSSAYFRLLLKKNLTLADPITVAIILSSADRKHLDDATKELDSSTDASCKAITLPTVSCMMFPALTGVNAEIRVKVNGKEAFARLGAQVNEVIREFGTDDMPRSVQVRRLFDKRLVPIKGDSDSKDLLALILMPGDVISYR